MYQTVYEQKFHVQPTLKIYTNKSIFFNRFIPLDPAYTYTRKAPKRTDFKKNLSEISIRKIKKIIDFMSDSAKWKKVWCKEEKKHKWFRLGFLTLTLPAPQLNNFGISENEANSSSFYEFEDLVTVSNCGFKYSDDEIKSFILNHFLTILREKYYVHNYLWKAEPQANGNIHFHIIIDRFIHWRALQYIWNRCLSKTTLIDEFEKKWGHRNPPTIKIHAIKDVKSIRKYLTKYLSKAEFEKRKIEGRKWACNEEISKYDGVSIALEGEYASIEWTLLKLPNRLKFVQPHFTCYNISIGQLATLTEGTSFINTYIERFNKAYNWTININ